MTFEKHVNGGEMTIAVTEKLDTSTAPVLSEEINGTDFGGIDTLIFDFSGLEYISSAGLRVLVLAYKKISGKKVVIRGANDVVSQALEITGLAKTFQIQ